MNLNSRRSILNMAFKSIDIGINLTDDMYKGIYHGKYKHEPDLPIVLERAWNVGLQKMIITGTSLSDSKKAIELSKTNEKLYCTVGCHPTRCNEFENENTDPEIYLQELLALIKNNPNKVVAVGECGLDYERLQFCSIEVQKKYFEKQLQLSDATGLPLFLHCRKAACDLLEILNNNKSKLHGAVVHSFDGTMDELEQILKTDLYIGINGCSLKTNENLKVAASIPLDKLLIETDSPWCEIRPTHAGYSHIQTHFPSKKKEKWEKECMVKSRNEPSCIIQVLEVLAALKKMKAETLAEIIFENTEKLFFLNKNQ